MEIKTGKAHSDPESAAIEVPPDRGRLARKKTAQKAVRGRSLGARLMDLFKVLAGVSMIAMLVLAAFASYRYACTTDILRVHTIKIDGCRHADPGKLEALVRQNLPQNILQVDLSELRARLEREPWVLRVEIRRILPETLKIHVVERIPSVIAEIGGELQLLDNEGVLLDRYGPNYGKLDVPVISGLKGDSVEAYRVLQEENSARIKVGIEVLTELASGAPEWTRAISEIDLSDTENVKVLLVDDTAEVYLGNSDFLKKIQMFMTNISQYQEYKAEGKDIAVIDLRFDRQIVYTLRHAAVVPAAGKTDVIKN
jgi:cell division protein FtsQ